MVQGRDFGAPIQQSSDTHISRLVDDAQNILNIFVQNGYALKVPQDSVFLRQRNLMCPLSTYSSQYPAPVASKEWPAQSLFPNESQHCRSACASNPTEAKCLQAKVSSVTEGCSEGSCEYHGASGARGSFQIKLDGPANLWGMLLNSCLSCRRKAAVL